MKRNYQNNDDDENRIFSDTNTPSGTPVSRKHRYECHVIVLVMEGEEDTKEDSPTRRGRLIKDLKSVWEYTKSVAPMPVNNAMPSGFISE